MNALHTVKRVTYQSAFFVFFFKHRSHEISELNTKIDELSKTIAEEIERL